MGGSSGLLLDGEKDEIKDSGFPMRRWHAPATHTAVSTLRPTLKCVPF